MATFKFEFSLGKFYGDSKIVHFDESDWLKFNALVKLNLISSKYVEYTFVYDDLYGLDSCGTCEYEHLKIVELNSINLN